LFLKVEDLIVKNNNNNNNNKKQLQSSFGDVAIVKQNITACQIKCCFHLFNIVKLIFPICVVICSSVALAGARELNIKQPPENDTDWNYNTPETFVSVGT